MWYTNKSGYYDQDPRLLRMLPSRFLRLQRSPEAMADVLLLLARVAVVEERETC